MGARPPAWDKYEAALLLEGVLDVQQKGMASSTVVKRVSEDLRKMAQNRGLEIDNLFRNVELHFRYRVWSRRIADIPFSSRQQGCFLKLQKCVNRIIHSTKNC